MERLFIEGIGSLLDSHCIQQDSNEKLENNIRLLENFLLYNNIRTLYKYGCNYSNSATAKENSINSTTVFRFKRLAFFSYLTPTIFLFWLQNIENILFDTAYNIFSIAYFCGSAHKKLGIYSTLTYLFHNKNDSYRNKHFKHFHI